MNLSFCDLKNKEVVNIKDGSRLGCVDDVCFDSETAKVIYLVVFGRLKLFGLLGREEGIIICWDEIEVIGEDAVLISPKRCLNNKRKKTNLFKKIFKID